MNPVEQQPSQTSNEPRLPQIDPITFSALNMLDGFVGKAPLTRQEHAEANKSLQHLVQTVEMLQTTVKELTRQLQAGSNTNGEAKSEESTKTKRFNGTASADDSRVVGEVAEEIFRKSK